VSELQLILLGAALALAGSIVGSMAIGRLEARHAARLRLYDELLPRLTVSPRAHPPTYLEEQMQLHDEIVRTSVLLRVREWRFANELRNLHAERMGLWEDRFGLPPLDTTKRAFKSELSDKDNKGDIDVHMKLYAVRTEFSEYLENRLSFPGPRLLWAWYRLGTRVRKRRRSRLGKR
jgi:hypothetical protein